MTKLLTFFLSLIIACSCAKQDEENNLFIKWKVEGWVQNDTSVAQTVNENLFISFNNNKIAHVVLTPNSCESEFTVDKSELSFSGLACTEICCNSELSNTFLTLLSLVESYHFTNGKLNLSGKEQLNIRLIKSEP